MIPSIDTLNSGCSRGALSFPFPLCFSRLSFPSLSCSSLSICSFLGFPFSSYPRLPLLVFSLCPRSCFSFACPGLFLGCTYQFIRILNKMKKVPSIWIRVLVRVYSFHELAVCLLRLGQCCVGLQSQYTQGF